MKAFLYRPIVLFPGEYARVGGFAPGGGDGEQGNHRQALLRGGFAAEEVPDFPRIRCAGGDGFGRVDHAAPAYGQQAFEVFAANQVDAGFHRGKARVGVDVSQFPVVDAGGFQGTANAVEQAAFLGTVASVNQQYAARDGFETLADLLVGAGSENDFGGLAVNEVFHFRNVFRCKWRIAKVILCPEKRKRGGRCVFCKNFLGEKGG